MTQSNDDDAAPSTDNSAGGFFGERRARYFSNTFHRAPRVDIDYQEARLSAILHDVFRGVDDAQFVFAHGGSCDVIISLRMSGAFYDFVQRMRKLLKAEGCELSVDLYGFIEIYPVSGGRPFAPVPVPGGFLQGGQVPQQ